ncbi:carbonic anhydrase, partial [Escherichia coli]|uniref:carbonic anhydrase n=1 Tax=Escherichia coli TaxID=562 RepID=UPI003B9F3D8F
MIEGLLANNLRWAASHARDDLFKRLARQDPPRIFWIGCCDCRMPANELIGLEPGAVFVHANLANQADARD